MKALDFAKNSNGIRVRKKTLDNAERAAGCLMLVEATNKHSTITVPELHDIFKRRGYEVSLDSLYRLLKDMPGFAPVYGPTGLTYYYEKQLMLQFVNDPSLNYPENPNLVQTLMPKKDLELTPLQADIEELVAEGVGVLKKINWGSDSELTLPASSISKDLESGALKTIIAASLILLKKVDFNA